MDKYEFRISLQEINQLIEEKRFDEAANVADSIDWNRVRNPETLCRVSDVYKINREYEKSRRVLMIAESRDPQNPEILFSLCELNIFLYGRDGIDADLVSAYQLKQRYQQMNPGSEKGLILEYKFYKATNVSAAEKAAVLERLKSIRYTARWGYELAKCYLEAGNREQAAAECRSVAAAFTGRYAERAKALLQEIEQDAGAGKEAAAAAGSTAAPDAQGSAPQEADTTAKDRAAQEDNRAATVPEEVQNSTKTRTGTEQETLHAQEEPHPAPDFGTPDTGILKTAAAREQDREEAHPTEEGTPADGTGEKEPGTVTGHSSDDGAGAQTAAGEGQTEAAPAEEEPVKEKETGREAGSTGGKPAMTINEVVDEWVKIRDQIRSQNDQRRKERLLEDTGSLMDAFDETAKHTMLEDIERNVERQQREARQGYAFNGVSTGQDDGAGERSVQSGYVGLNEPPVRRTASEVAQPDYGQDYAEDARIGSDGQGYTDNEPVDSYDQGYQDDARDEGYNQGYTDNTPADSYDQGYQDDARNGGYSRDYTVDASDDGYDQGYADETPAETYDTDYTDETPAEPEVQSSSEGESEADAGAAGEENVREESQGEQFNTAPQPYRETGYRETLYDEGTESGRAATYEPLYRRPAMTAEAAAERQGAAPEEAAQEEPVLEEAVQEEAPQEEPVQAEAVQEGVPQEEPEQEEAAQGISSEHDFGSVEEAAEPVETYPRRGRATRRWSAADVRRAMEMNRERFEALEEADREALQDAVENAGQEQTTAAAAPAQSRAAETDGNAAPAAEPVKESVIEGAAKENTTETPVKESVAEAPVMESGTPAEEAGTGEPADGTKRTAEVKAQQPQMDTAAESEQNGTVMPEESEEAVAPAAAQEEELQEEQGSPDKEETEEAVPEETAPEESVAEEQPERKESAPQREKRQAPAPSRRTETTEQRRVPARHADLPEKSSAGQDFSDEEKKVFGPIAYVKANRDQIVTALDKVSLAGDDGNVIITGGPAAAERCARGLLHLIRHSDSNFSSEVAVATAEQMNRLDAARLSRALDKIENGAIKITGAGALSQQALTALRNELENKERGIIVLLLDTRRAMDALLKKYGSFLESFNVRIDIHPLDDKALVAYGMEYALHQDYSIDELGQLALSTRISSLQTRNHHVSTSEVRDIVDEAIRYASRKNLHTFFAVLTRKRYDADDRIIIHEKDFMHY